MKKGNGDDMYHEERRFTIFSNKTELETLLRPAIKNGPVTYHIHTSSLINEGWTDSDIILCDIPVKRLMPYRMKMKKDAWLLYIYSPADDICLDKDIASDELMARPLNSAYLLRRIQFLCDQIKLKEDAWLASTYLDVLIDSMPDLVWFKDNDGIHVKVNKVFCHTVGKKREDITGRNHCSVWDVDVDDCKATEDIVRQQKKTCRFNELVQSRNGMRQFNTYKTPLFDRNGEIMGTVGIGHDVTDLENMSTEMEILLNSMPFAILVKDQEDVIVNVNAKFEEYFYTSKDIIIGHPYQQWYDNVFNNHRGMAGHDSEEVHLVHGDIDLVLEITHEAIYDIFKSNVGELCIYRDITKEAHLKEQLSNNSNTDFLTGLCNRRYFYKYYNDISPYKQISLLYVDLDHFKLVNDTYGHQIGDEALIIVADTLNKCFSGDLIARLGGDEFLVSKTYRISREELLRQADTFLASLREAFSINRYFNVLTASIGIAWTTDTSQKIDSLIKESDLALYKAKQTGRAKCCVYESE